MPSGRILLFDLDGTLVDSAQTIAAALSRLSAGRGGGVVDVTPVRRWISLGVERLVANALGSFASRSEDDVAAFRSILVTMTTKADAVYPDVRQVMADLRSQVSAIGIVTNKPEHLARALLADVGLESLFDVVVGGDTAGQPKPHSAPMHHALSILGGIASEAVFIGDSDVDAAAAKGVEMPFILFDGGYGPVPSDMASIHGRFATFAALPETLARI